MEKLRPISTWETTCCGLRKANRADTGPVWWPGWASSAFPPRGACIPATKPAELNIPIRLLVALHQIYHCGYDCFFEGLTLGEMG